MTCVNPLLFNNLLLVKVMIKDIAEILKAF